MLWTSVMRGSFAGSLEHYSLKDLRDAVDQTQDKVMNNDLPHGCSADDALCVAVSALSERLRRIEDGMVEMGQH